MEVNSILSYSILFYSTNPRLKLLRNLLKLDYDAFKPAKLAILHLRGNEILRLLMEENKKRFCIRELGRKFNSQEH